MRKLPVVMAMLCSGVSLPALAQGASPDTEQSKSGQTSIQSNRQEEIVVTGSRIARRDFTAESPVYSITAESLKNTGQPLIGEALSQLPQLAGVANAGSPYGGPQYGRSFSDLRGLGSARTLVLLDGRRITPQDINNNVDTSVIPDGVLGGVEILTGGASATYGSDALSGVVNFKTDQNFSGLRLDAQIGFTNDGGGRSQKYSATFGTKTEDGRGHVMMSLGYLDRRGIGLAQRRATTDLLEPPPFTGAGDISLAAQNPFAPPNFPNQATVNAVFARYGVAPGRVPNNDGFGVNPDGTLFSNGAVPGFPTQNANLAPTPGYENVIKNGRVLARFLDSFATFPQTKYNFFATARYELSEGLELYATGLYNRTNSNYPRPAFNIFNGIPATNPYIPADLKTLLNSRPNPAAPIASVITLNPLFARLDTRDTSTTYQFWIGARGAVPVKDWTYDVFFSRGSATTTATTSGNLNYAATYALIDAADGGASVCPGGFNLFPAARLDQRCLDRISQSVRTESIAEMDNAEATLQGSLFAGWAGDIRFALGAAYRKNSFTYTPDPATFLIPRSGNPALGRPDHATVIGTGLDTAARVFGETKSKEVYAELLIPLLRDVTLVKNLEVNLGYRYTDSSINGGISTYRANGNWTVIDPIRVRGGWQRSIRAPNIGELFTPLGAGDFLSGLIGPTATGGGDPCDSTNISFRNGKPDTARVEALCVALGLPAAELNTYRSLGTVVSTLVGGNPNLEPEVGTSWTLGVVLQSPSRNPWLSGLSLSVDYFDIKIKGAVGSLVPAQSLNRCFNAVNSNPTFDPANPYCQLVLRNGTANSLALGRDSGTGPGRINGILRTSLNLGGYHNAGIDIQGRWRVALDDAGVVNAPLAVRLDGTLSYIEKYELQATSTDPFVNYAGTIGNNQVGGYSHPRWKSVTNLAFDYNNATVGLRWRHIGAMRNAANVGTTQTQQGTPAVNYFDLRAGYVTGPVRFDATISNLANKMPPVYSGTAYDAATFDISGRTYMLGVTAKF